MLYVCTLAITYIHTHMYVVYMLCLCMSVQLAGDEGGPRLIPGLDAGRPPLQLAWHGLEPVVHQVEAAHLAGGQVIVIVVILILIIIV